MDIMELDTYCACDHDDWEEIKKEITCSICFELFTDPRTLPCLHTFCKSCIQRSVEIGLAKVPEGFFECPLCRAHVPLPAKGIDGISANFSTKRLIEIYSKHQEVVVDSAPKCRLCTNSNPATMWCIECDCAICPECFDAHKRMKMFSRHQVIPIQEFTSDPKRAIRAFLNPGVCPAHPDQVLKFYCYTCAQTICVECALLKHRDHNFDAINNVIMEQGEEIMKTAAVLEPMRDEVCEAMNRIAASKDDITDNHVVNVIQVDSFFEELHQILERQREVTLKKLESLKITSHKSLDIQNDDLAFLESKIKSCREFVLNLIDNGSATEILSFKSKITDRVNELTGLMEQASLEPACTADATVSCIDSTKFVTMCQSVCHVFCSPNLPNCVMNKPTRHYIDDDGKLVNAVSVTVSLQDRHGNVVIGQCEHLQVTSALVSNVIVKEQDEGGVYNITYQPISVETDDVIIKWNGHDIFQFNVPALHRDYTALRVAIPVEEINTAEKKECDNVGEEGDGDETCIVTVVRGLTVISVEQPIDMEGEKNDEDDSKFVACNVDGATQECTLYGNFEEECPLDYFSDDTIDAFEIDCRSSTVSEDDKEGFENGIKTITTYGPDVVEFGVVYSFCNGPNDELIVADSDNDKLIVFNKSLQYSHSIGEATHGVGDFEHPTGVACDKAGKLFVVDNGNHRIQVFKLSGEFVTTIGTKGSGDGEFDEPFRLLLSSTGLLFVCDLGNKGVQVFDTKHYHLFQYSFGQGRFVLDLTLNATEDKLFAVDFMSILVFTPQGHFLHSIAVDPLHCGLFISSVCSTPDGHLLVGSLTSSGLLSVYHEDGTLVCGGNTSDYTELLECVKDTDDKLTTAVHYTRNGQIMIFHKLKIILL